MEDVRDIIINAVETCNAKSEMLSSLLRYLSIDDLVNWFVSNDYDDVYICDLTEQELNKIRNYHFIHN